MDNFVRNLHVMVLNVAGHQANIDSVTDAFNRAEIGNVYSVVIKPNTNGMYRLIVGLDWFKTSQLSHTWQRAILDETQKAELEVTPMDKWVIIPVPIDEYNNQLWQENVIMNWMIDTHPKVEKLDNKFHLSNINTSKPKHMVVPDHVVISVV